ncbi:sarcosine oxidase subunit gamma [Candidatus Pantoea formicae]|uniref:sarcosine oxidase subunit gamma n=1 Tax=Candidatus Pantoea formicae TaxID=2608355 RepID=UPI003ED8B7C7
MMQNMHVLAAGPLDHLEAASIDNGAIALHDCSHQARVGFRGRHAAWYLQQRGFVLPDQPNQCCWQSDGSLVARLSQTEFLILAADNAPSRIQHEEQSWQMNELSCFMLPRQDTHAWLVISGDQQAAMMAKLCAVDLSSDKFLPGAVAQTSVARANALIINASLPDNEQFWLLVDYSMAAYFWDVLLDAMAEFAR